MWNPRDVTCGAGRIKAGMLELLGTRGAERAERSLSGFLEQVRAAAPCPAASPHQVVLAAGIGTLERRREAARAALDAALAKADATARAVAGQVRVGLAEAETMTGAADPASMRDLAGRSAALSSRVGALDRRYALLRRALAWLGDVSAAAAELERKAAGFPNGVDAPGLLRTLTEMGALLSTMTDAIGRDTGLSDAVARVPSSGDAAEDRNPADAIQVLGALARDLERLMRDPTGDSEGEDDGRTR